MGCLVETKLLEFENRNILEKIEKGLGYIRQSKRKREKGRETEIKTFTPSVHPSVAPLDVAAALAESTAPLAVAVPLAVALPVAESTLGRRRRLQLPSAAASLSESKLILVVLLIYSYSRFMGKPVAPKSDSRPSFEVDLPDAEIGKVRFRFAPEPSGYLHIGHSKAALLNQYFAQRYQGQLIVRFDDTNPAKESNEFVDNILKDIETLGIKYEAVTYTSDYFPDLMEMAETLIRQGKAYVDDTPRDQMQKERMVGIESKCRNNSVEENMKLWKEMIVGSERGLQCCLRGKEGISHALRSSEYHDRNAQYYRIQEDMGMRKVHIYEFSRLNMVYTLLSKRKLLMLVQNGKADGWDDPRFPTVQGIVRRGLKVEALIQFILEQGASKNLNLMEWDKLWTINKKIIDPVCPRHTAVNEERRVLLTLTNGPDEPFVRIIPRHGKYEGAGEKATTYTKSIWLDHDDAKSVSVDEEVTLKDWGNAIVKEIIKDQDGNVTQLTGVLHLEGSVKTTKLKLTWLPKTSELVNLTLVGFDYLITKKKLEEEDLEEGNFLKVLNPCTRFETAAVGDSNLRNLKHGEVLQLERKGYFIRDVPFTRPSKPIVLFAIPDGRQKAAPF
ncbi:hypothetical protein LWI29_029566 [Acer saccharum]|uniref:glutamate--tRNA ligase n=1 Tax=Acer saccharum TaxID=4024 RepID=A0AA39RNF7_ACESA|nr:hypothetical protein LWI29_029566 [Acer saccharum]